MPRLSSVVAATALLLVSGAAQAAPPKDLDAYVNRAIKTFGAPGMAVAVVEDGKTVVTRGYGVRKLGEPGLVDEHTVFPIGSNTKAFTSAALAILIDEGKLAWDDKVVSHLPGFQMYDPYVTGEMTVTDLLVHRSGLGLGEGDLMFYPPTTFTRQEIVERLRYLKPATSFRSAFAYDNMLFIAAGQLVAHTAGESWDDFMRQRVFKPLGMPDATATSGELAPGANRGWPHIRTGGEVRGLGEQQPMPHVELIDNAGPAGSINASAVDMSKWLQVQLSRGVMPNGQRLFNAEQAAAMWTPQTLIPTRPLPGALAPASEQFSAYALGWFVRDWRGHKVYTHDGGVPGGVSTVMVIPEKHVAFAVMTNSEEIGALHSVDDYLLDHYFGEPQTDWTTLYKQAIDAAAARGVAFMKAQPAGQAEGPPASLPIGKFAGVYRDPWYGTVTITPQGQGLAISFDRTPTMKGTLEHVAYDTFRTRFTDKAIEDAYVTFTLAPDGSIATVKMKAISPLADFSFDYQDLSFTPDKAQ
jgi:CubicO group peptidase (beta-lactamase class C family)